jgi:hypothetical protein
MNTSKVKKKLTELYYKMLQFAMPWLFTRSFDKWYRWQFKALPVQQLSFFDSEPTEWECIVILPMKHMHDAGFRCMSFIGIKNNGPVYRWNVCCDVISINGIGGFGKNWSPPPFVTPCKAWSIDCMYNGLFRIFCHGATLTVRRMGGFFEIFADLETSTQESELNKETQVKPNT